MIAAVDSRAPIILFDAHVHLHAAADAAALLSAAARNLRNVSQRLGPRTCQQALLLAEMAGSDWFGAQLALGAAASGCDGWRIRPSAGESIGLQAEADDQRLLIVAGRQIVTRERIEVLALGTRALIDDGLPLDEVLHAARQAQALIVLPWGFGKWLGRRGRQVRAALRGASGCPLYAGDNAGRPAVWPRPAVFAECEAKGRPVLPGTDPLPLPGEELRVGSSGCWFEGRLPEVAPATRLCELLRQATPATLHAFGRRESLRRCVRNQLAVRRVAPVVAVTGAATLPATPDIETSSAAYASRFRGAAGRYLLGVQSDAVSLALRGVAPGTALDVGGGHGQLVDLLRQLGWKVTVQGTDAACERNLRELHGQRDVPFIAGSLSALPASDRSYDLVIAVRLISHVTDWQRLIEEMCRVARRSVVVDYPRKSGINALTPLLFGLKKSLEGNTRTYTSFSSRELNSQFSRQGFRATRAVGQFVLPMVVHRIGKAAAPLRAIEAFCRVIGLTNLAGSPVILRADRDRDRDRDRDLDRD